MVGEKRRHSPRSLGPGVRITVWALGVGLLGAACSQTPTLTLTNPPRSGFCVFPQACYVADCPCDEGARCRYQGPDAGELYTSAEPLPTDPAVLCQSAGSLRVACLLPEMVCVARGAPCSTSCASKAQGCAAGERYTPQRRGGDGGMQTYCPRLDQVCCPAPDGGGAVDAGPSDLMSLPG